MFPKLKGQGTAKGDGRPHGKIEPPHQLRRPWKAVGIRRSQTDDDELALRRRAPVAPAALPAVSGGNPGHCRPMAAHVRDRDEAGGLFPAPGAQRLVNLSLRVGDAGALVI